MGNHICSHSWRRSPSRLQHQCVVWLNKCIIMLWISFICLSMYCNYFIIVFLDGRALCFSCIIVDAYL
uniref:Uncharacterized protein n=1 Tax=Picea sitchensis TaxID=3332 RepID=C0PPS6_PICSI|nr:unknown [Picea sitchensis]